MPGRLQSPRTLPHVMQRRDVDGIVKACLDTLVEHQVIRDDSLVVSVTAAWADDVPPGRVRIELEAATAPKRHADHAGVAS
jgi:Holliday junction resolvase RusA-like endonuclease